MSGQLVFSTPSTRLETTMLMIPPAVAAGMFRTLSKTRLMPDSTAWTTNSTGAANTNRKSIGSVMQVRIAVMMSGRMMARVLSRLRL